MMRIVLASAASMLIVLSPAATAQDVVIGRPLVVGGDTMRLRGSIVGLYGVAAPGLAQTCETAKGKSFACGRRAQRALADHIGDRIVACEPRGADRNKRQVALCRVQGEDLGAWMVARGHAVADRNASPDYVSVETKAWGTRAGLWAGVFEDPANRKRDEVPTKPQISALTD